MYINIYQVRLLIFYLLFILPFSLTAQSFSEKAEGLSLKNSKSFWEDISISVDFAAAYHDMRFSKRKPLCTGCQSLERQPGKWGTWQYGISVHKPLLQWKILTLEAGLGYSLEHLTYFRRIDHCFGSAICSDILVHNDNYKIHLIHVPVRTSFRFARNLEMAFAFLPQVDIYKKLIGRRGSRGKTTIDFYSIEINPGLSYRLNRIQVRLNYRMYQIKKVDPVIYSLRTINSNQEDALSLLDKKFDSYNPLKFWFSVGYRLGAPE